MKSGKRFIRIIFIGVLLVSAVAAWLIFGSNTNFSEDKKAFYIKTGNSFENVMTDLESQRIVKNPEIFSLIAKRIGYDKNIKPGKYVITNGTSIYRLMRTLRSGRQTPVNFVITKLRTKEDLAQKLVANFEGDSIKVYGFLNSNDSLKQFGLDTNTVMTAIIPNTYTLLWNTSTSKIFRKLYNEQGKFWNEERTKKAEAMNMTAQQVYTLASIVEEETNKDEDKGNVASVYINRIHTGQRLEADPTIKFALRNFGLKRIYSGHKLAVENSPYNTYFKAGLPPGPICTPSIKTIDAVLNAPSTDYLYFVAKPDQSGLSNFTSSFAQHQENARNYQHYLDSINIK